MKLVNTILAVHDERFDVIVSDDCSDDDTIEKLSTIDDERLRIFRNRQRVGAKKNWFYTIDRGDAKYILHLLDRDMMNVEYLKDIISTLEESEVGYGYIGVYASGLDNDKSRLSECIYHKGAEAMMEFGCTFVHPTGFFVKRRCWNSIESKISFFSESCESIYPHSYIYMCLCERENGMALRWKAFDTDNYSNIGRYKSAFYNEKKNDYWWLPQVRMKEFFHMSEYVWLYVLKKNIKVELLLNRFRTSLRYATIDYLFLSMDEKNSRHYGYKKAKVRMEELVNINQTFTDSLIRFLDVREGLDEKIIDRLTNIADRNIESIKQQYDFSDRIMQLDKNLTLMDAWLGLRLQGMFLADRLVEKGIKNVAIYGHGKIGKKLYQELKEKINVVFFIDRQADRMREDIPVFNIDDKFPLIELIIISLPDYFEEIKYQLSNRGINNVINIEDIVYDCYT